MAITKARDDMVKPDPQGDVTCEHNSLKSPSCDGVPAQRQE
jgi:hypothetical protein